MSAIFLPLQIASMGAKAVRAAYSAQRAIANKRIGRLEGAGLGTGKQGKFPTLRGMTDEQARAALAEVSRWNRDTRHTVRGERRFMKQEIEGFKRMGYDWIDESNFYQFTQYMDELREKYGNKAFDSGDAVDVFNNAQKIGIDSDTLRNNFEYFAEHNDALERMRPARSAWGSSMEGLKDKIRKLER